MKKLHYLCFLMLISLVFTACTATGNNSVPSLPQSSQETPAEDSSAQSAQEPSEQPVDHKEEQSKTESQADAPEEPVSMNGEYPISPADYQNCLEKEWTWIGQKPIRDENTIIHKRQLIFPKQVFLMCESVLQTRPQTIF